MLAFILAVGLGLSPGMLTQANEDAQLSWKKDVLMLVWTQDGETIEAPTDVKVYTVHCGTRSGIYIKHVTRGVSDPILSLRIVVSKPKDPTRWYCFAETTTKDDHPGPVSQEFAFTVRDH